MLTLYSHKTSHVFSTIFLVSFLCVVFSIMWCSPGFQNMFKPFRYFALVLQVGRDHYFSSAVFVAVWNRFFFRDMVFLGLVV